jgi:hypothetical protein
VVVAEDIGDAVSRKRQCQDEFSELGGLDGASPDMSNLAVALGMDVRQSLMLDQHQSD